MYVSAHLWLSPPTLEPKVKVQIMIPNDKQLLASKGRVMYAFFTSARSIQGHIALLTRTYSFLFFLSLHALPCCSPLALSQKYTHWPIPMGLAWIGGSCFSIYATPR